MGDSATEQLRSREFGSPQEILVRALGLEHALVFSSSNGRANLRGIVCVVVQKAIVDVSETAKKG